MAHEPTIALRVLRSVLSAVPNLRGVYVRTVTGNPAMPYALIVPNGGGVEMAAGSRVFAEPVYLVKVVSVDVQQDKTAEAALEAIDAALEGYQGIDSVSGARITIRGTASLPGFTENSEPSSTSFRHEGAYWRVTVALT